MICFDTMVLIWGVQGAARAGQEPMIERTRRYIHSLRKTNERVLVPTPALAEYLQNFDDRDRRRQLDLLAQHFFIASFNLPAAYLAAGLARKAAGVERSAEVSRQAQKTDVQIIATAVVHGASRIVTNDCQHFVRLAAGKIPVIEVPDIHEQQHLELNP